MQRIDSRYKDAINKSLINTGRKSTWQKREKYEERVKDKQFSTQEKTNN
jgi:hypothetical protein